MDTVNRTYRNIDIAIVRQHDDVAALTVRVAKLDPKSFGKLPSRDKRLPDKPSRRFNVTPSVAATTAAALNAERSAYKLKQVLLSVRDKPLLNDRAARTTPARVDFKTPQKPSTGWENSAWQITSSPTPSAPIPPARDVESPPSTGGSRRGAGSKYHQKSAPLKRPVFTPAESQAASPTPAAPAPAPTGFDWGPLPTHALNKKPVSSLPFSIQ
jgi:nucleoporin NUP159